MTPRIFAVVCALLLLSCKQGGGSSTSGGPISLDRICATYLDDLCAALLNCTSSSYGTVEQCRLDHDCLGLANLEKEIAGGWTEYSPEAAGRCHAQVRADLCTFAQRFSAIPTLPEVLASCPDVLVGHGASGDRCVGDGDCAGGYCLHTNGCVGACKRLLQNGEGSCSITNERCDRVANLECLGGTCGARATKQGDPCRVTGDCHGENLWCDKQTCVAAHHEGQPCADFGAQCTKDLRCFSEVCRKPRRLGETCYTAECVRGTTCSNGACVALPAVGEACGGQALFPCAAGAQCTGSVCQARRYPGERCDGLSMCVVGQCDGATCVAGKLLGEACATDGDCRSHYCDGETCADPTSCPGAGAGGMSGSSVDAASDARDGAMADLQPLPDVAEPAELFVGTWTYVSGNLNLTCAGGLNVPPVALAGRTASIQREGPSTVVLAMGDPCTVRFEVTANVAVARPNQICVMDWGGSLELQRIDVASWTLTRSGDHLDEILHGAVAICTVSDSGDPGRLAP